MTVARSRAHWGEVEGAVRVVDVELTRPLDRLRADPTRAYQHDSAQVIARVNGHPIGRCTVALDHGEISAEHLAARIWAALGEQVVEHLSGGSLARFPALTSRGLPANDIVTMEASSGALPDDLPTVSVVIATRDRPRSLATCLSTIGALDYPVFDVIVVDNCPAGPETAELVADLQRTMANLLYFREDRAGLANAHNRGLAEASGEIVAFTDDDVLADPQWLLAIARAFAVADRVACVTGLILPAELETPAQRWAEDTWSIGKGFRRKIFDLHDHRPEDPLFPYAAGMFGSGANMAFRTSALRSLGGFDGATGTGTKARGGDDLDAFYRIVTSGYGLVYEPAAIVYHHHHRDQRALRRQAFGYGVGLSAYLTKLLLKEPRLLGALLPRLPRALAHARTSGRPAAVHRSSARMRGIASRRWLGMLLGPAAYLQSSRQASRLNGEPAPSPAPSVAPCPPPSDVAHLDDTPLVLDNLLLGLDGLTRLLVDRLERRDWTDGYLLAAGMSQIAEDYLFAASSLAVRAADHLASNRPGAALARGLQLLDARRRSPAGRRTIVWQAAVAKLCLDLAPLVLGRSEPPSDGGCQRQAQRLAEGLAGLPKRLRGEMVRLPSCFHRFDQRPEDLLVLAAGIRQRWSPDLPILVVGVRTSGSYLAPLQVAALQAAGFRDVRMITVRPGQRASKAFCDELARVRTRGGLAVVVDDPPSSGRAVGRVIDHLRRHGLPLDSTVLAVQLFGGGELPPALGGVSAVTLAWPDWSVHRRLTPTAVARDLQTLRGPGVTVMSARPVAGEDQPRERRGHLHAAFEVELRDAGGGLRTELIAVEGAGVGYLGTHALAVSQALGTRSAKIYGVRDGMLYREWLAPECSVARLSPAQQRDLAPTMADHVARRAAALPLAEDPGPRLGGQGAAWQVASMLLSRVFARSAPIVRMLATDRTMRRLLRVGSPAVIDGSTELGRWFLTGPNRVVKVGGSADQASRLLCFDAVFDLAGIAAGERDRRLADELRRAFGARHGMAVDAERWLLYLLVHVWDRHRRGVLPQAEMARLSSLAVQHYLADRVLAGMPCPVTGPIWAIDLDGVFEGSTLGWPAPTPASVLALRALMAHGYRPVPVTGRSLDDVRDRCESFGLPGGVAEYGAVVYRHHDNRVVDASPRETLDELRAALLAVPDTELDATFRIAVSAGRVVRGRRAAMELSVVDRIVAARPDVLVIPGEGQTDFLPAGVDKGAGLLALSELLNPTGRPGHIAAAVGDTKADIPMFGPAERSFAPAHADPACRKAGATVMPHPYQQGLFDAVGHVIGHRPGGCPRCAAPPVDAHARLLLSLLGAAEGSKLLLLRRAIELMGLAWVS